MKTTVVPKGQVPKLLGPIDFSSLLGCEISSDVLLIPRDGNEGIRAHKVVLAAFSPFLKECLLDEPVYLCDKILQLHLPDYSHAAITDFLKVLYGCEDNEEQVLTSLEAVESLWRQEVPPEPRSKRGFPTKKRGRPPSLDPKTEKVRKKQESLSLTANSIVCVKVEEDQGVEKKLNDSNLELAENNTPRVKGEPKDISVDDDNDPDFDPKKDELVRKKDDREDVVEDDENEDEDDDGDEEDDDEYSDDDDDEDEDDAWSPMKGGRSGGRKPGRAPPLPSDQYTRQKYNLKQDANGMFPCNVEGCDYKSKNNNTTRQHIYRFHFGRNRDWYQRTKAKRNRDGTPRGRGRPKRDEEVFDPPPKPEPKDSSSEGENSDDGSQNKEKINYNKAYAQMNKWELCAHCGVSVLVTEMSKHCFNYHGVKLPFQCTDCDESFTSEIVLERHREKHIYKLCPYCKIVVRDAKKMESHLAGCNMKKLREIKPLKIKNRRRRRPGYEEIEFEPNKEDPTKCPKCDYRNPKLTRVRGHYVSRHIRQQCPHCDKKLLFASMERHILMNHRPDLLKFECKDCNKKFFNERLLKFHNEENHIKELKYICDHCAMSFYSEFKLSHHVTIKHRTPQTHPCPFCDKTYRDRDSRRKHLRRYHPDKWRDKDKDEMATYISNKCFGATMNHGDKDGGAGGSNDEDSEVVPSHSLEESKALLSIPQLPNQHHHDQSLHAQIPQIPISMANTSSALEHQGSHASAHPGLLEAQMQMERLTQIHMEGQQQHQQQQHQHHDGGQHQLHHHQHQQHQQHQMEAARLNAFRLNEALRLNEVHLTETARLNALRMNDAMNEVSRLGDHHLNIPKVDLE